MIQIPHRGEYLIPNIPILTSNQNSNNGLQILRVTFSRTSEYTYLGDKVTEWHSKEISYPLLPGEWYQITNVNPVRYDSTYWGKKGTLVYSLALQSSNKERQWVKKKIKHILQSDNLSIEQKVIYVNSYDLNLKASLFPDKNSAKTYAKKGLIEYVKTQDKDIRWFQIET